MLILDKRIHRSVRLGAELSNSPNYSVKLTSNAAGTVNTLTIVGLTAGTISATVDCENIFTPPNCGTVIARVFNGNTQIPIDPTTTDLSAFRFYELHQLLNRPAAGIPTLIVRSTNATGVPEGAASTLHITPAGASPEFDTVIPLGDKIPPNLG